MGFAGGQRPSGVGYTHDQPPKYSPLESPAPWTDKRGQRRRRPSLKVWVLLAIAIVLVIVASVIGVLAFVVVVNYPQQQNVNLGAGNDWNSTVCISVPTDGSSTNVTFSWTTSPSTIVSLEAVSWGHNLGWSLVYDAIATTGSGTYIATGSDYFLAFNATGVPTLPAFVHISLSYDVPGHIIGGPESGLAC